MLCQAGGGNWNGFAPVMLRRLYLVTHTPVSPSTGPGWKSRTVFRRAERSSLKHLLQTDSSYRGVSRLPDPPKPVIGPVPFEGVSPSVIDQSNWSSLASFLH